MEPKLFYDFLSFKKIMLMMYQVHIWYRDVQLNFLNGPKFALFTHLYIAHSFLSKLASKMAFDFMKELALSYQKIVETNKRYGHSKNTTSQ